jgi:hypothetical protein
MSNLHQQAPGRGLMGEPKPKDTVPCEACGVSIAAPRWFCGRCAKDRREGRKP